MEIMSNSEKSVRDFIVNFVEAHWARQGTVCYLSALGLRLKREIPNCIEVISDGLAEYLRQNPIVQVVQYPEIKQKIGAVPLEAKLPTDVRLLFSGGAAQSKDLQKFSYRQDFWSTFAKPLDVDKITVHVSEGDDVQISKGQTMIDPVGKCYYINQLDLPQIKADSTVNEKVLQTNEAINIWLDTNSLDRRLFSKDLGYRAGVRGESRMNVLLDALKSLSQSDQARISIPLDIILKLATEK
jgi:hypothetical protein